MDLMDNDDSLWAWACSVYADAEVAEAGLLLQDAHDQCLSFLLWAAWSGVEDPGVVTRAAQIAADWEAAAVAPLRTLRRALKAPQDGVGDGPREALRTEIKAAELSAERVLLEALEALAPRSRHEILTSLSLASMAWRTSAPADVLVRLAAALTGATGEVEQAALRERLEALRQEHAELDASIHILAAAALPDMMLIARLKRKKLALKDAIVALEDELNPDIIA